MDAQARKHADMRKVQLVGGTTYSVTLPKPWVDSVGISVGSQVEVRPQADGNLLVVPLPGTSVRRRFRRFELNAETPDEVFRLLVGLYVSGYDNVELSSTKPIAREVRWSIEAASVRLRGMQIVEEGPSRILLQALEDARVFDVSKAIHRMHLHVQRMMGTAAMALTTRELRIDLKQVELWEEEIDHSMFLLFKGHNRLTADLSFNGQNGIDVNQSLPCMLVAMYLERIGDYALSVARIIHQVAPGSAGGSYDGADDAMRERHSDRVVRVQALLQKAVHAFQRKDIKLANEAIQGCVQLETELGWPATSPAISAGGVDVLDATLVSHLDRIARYTRSLGETAVNAAVAIPSNER